MSLSNPWASTSRSSATPCGMLASSSSAWRCSALRGVFRGGTAMHAELCESFADAGHVADIGLKNKSKRTISVKSTWRESEPTHWAKKFARSVRAAVIPRDAPAPQTFLPTWRRSASVHPTSRSILLRLPKRGLREGQRRALDIGQSILRALQNLVKRAGQAKREREEREQKEREEFEKLKGSQLARDAGSAFFLAFLFRRLSFVRPRRRLSLLRVNGGSRRRRTRPTSAGPTPSRPRAR